MGKKALYKEQLVLDVEENSNMYAELIVEELSKQMGFECAHCDLAMHDGKKGILSYCVKGEDEELHSLNSLVGETNSENEFADATDIIPVLKKTMEFFKKEGLNREDISKIITDVEKLLVFDTFVMATDRHTENISFIRDAKGKWRLAPIYDNENTLMLDVDNSILEDLRGNKRGIINSADIQQPRIGIMPDSEDDLKYSMWKDTFGELQEDDNVYDFMMDCYEKLDIDSALVSVEERIGCKLPDRVTDVARIAFNARKREIDRVMCQEYDDIGDEELI